MYGTSRSTIAACIKYFKYLPYRVKLLADWLKRIPNLPNTIETYYYPRAFLRDVTDSSYPLAKCLHEEVIGMIIPLQKEIPIIFYPQEPNQGDSLQCFGRQTYMLIFMHTYSYIPIHTYIH